MADRDRKKQQLLEASRRWRAKHPDRAREVGREAYHRQRAKQGKVSTPRVAATPDEVEERKAKRREYLRQWAKEWREKHPEKARAHKRKHYEKNAEKYKERAKQRYYEHRDELTSGMRRRRLMRLYGLTIEQYKALGAACMICGATEDQRVQKKTGKPFRLAVDHDHDTGKVRGLLCGACNCGIGYFKHDEQLLAKAIEYLRRTC